MVALLTALWSAPLLAGSFTVSPVRLDLQTGQSATSLKVGNDSGEAKLIQVTVLRWTRDNGQDQYAVETGPAAPIVTPPLFQLPAGGGNQVVRIGFQKAPAPAAAELAWRVIVEEVTPAAAVSMSNTVAMRLRVSLPLFLAPASPRRALRWEGSVAADGVNLTAINAGNLSERLDQLELKAPGGQPLGRLSGPIYIFPGERRSLPLPATAPKPGTARLELQGTPPSLSDDVVLRAQ
jgi:fimbrial chaperone protein